MKVQMKMRTETTSTFLAGSLGVRILRRACDVKILRIISSIISIMSIMRNMGIMSSFMSIMGIMSIFLRIFVNFKKYHSTERRVEMKLTFHSL